jgi:hypothetical protein
MWLSSWLRNRNAPPAGKSVRTRRSVRRPATCRPRLESLEARDVPSTLTVTNILDSGAGSLRGDIAAARSGDTIVFDPSLAGQQIQLTSLELYINKSLTIQGLPTQSVISGALSHSRVFDVAAGVSVTLTNLAIIDGTGIADALGVSDGGNNGRGGGIFNSGTLTLQNCTVSGNTATQVGPNFGGGIYNAGTLTVVGSIVSGNTAGSGGGIYNNMGATLSVAGSTLSGNTAGFEGGGLYNAFKATATVMNSTLSGNTAGYEGGGIYTAFGKLTVGSSLFSANTPDNIFGNYTDKKGNTFV